MGRFSAVLLASQHFSSCKRFVPLLPWRGVTLFEHQLEVLERTGAESVVVVLGHRAHELSSLVVLRPKVRTVVDPRYVQGGPSSLRAALHALGLQPETAVLVLPVEYPVDNVYLDRFVVAGMEGLQAGADVISSKLGSELVFPILLGRAALERCRRRWPRTDTLSGLLRHAGVVARQRPWEGRGGPPIHSMRDYDQAWRAYSGRRQDERGTV